MFDTPNEAPSIPRGLDPKVRKAAIRVLEHGPHLREAQMDMVIRYAALQVQHKADQDQIAEQGRTVESGTGTLKAHPLIPVVQKTETMLLQLEKALAIAVSSRREHLTKDEQVSRARPAPSKPKPVADSNVSALHPALRNRA